MIYGAEDSFVLVPPVTIFNLLLTVTFTINNFQFPNFVVFNDHDENGARRRKNPQPGPPSKVSEFQTA
jgi:hypothetical protein